MFNRLFGSNRNKSIYSDELNQHILSHKSKKTKKTVNMENNANNIKESQKHDTIDNCDKYYVCLDKLDRVLDIVLSDANLTEKFKNYCEEKYCVENILFLLECKELDGIREFDKKFTKAKAMYYDYFVEDSKNQLNVSDKTVKNVKEVLRIGEKDKRVYLYYTMKKIGNVYKKAVKEIRLLLVENEIYNFIKNNDEFFIIVTCI